MTFSGTERGQRWIEQFEVVEQPDASRLLDAVRWVSAAEFASAMRSTIEAEASSVDGPVALFVERKLRHPGGYTQYFYKQSSKPRRAHGVALQPVEGTKPYKYEVGSEGVIATLATSFVRENSKKYFLHPTAEAIRENKIRAFFVLTDTIGTGQQAREFLDSIWKVASVRSWMSSHLISCRVVAFASTDSGKTWLESHSIRPKVISSVLCPTIDSSFFEEDARRIRQLCRKYDPTKDGSFLGFGDEGVLIAYGHGIPNNAPAILHVAGKHWEPLFQGRVAGDLADQLPTGFHEVAVNDQLLLLNQARLANAASWLDRLGPDARLLVLILAAVSRPPRNDVAISRRTNIILSRVRQLIKIAIHFGWLNAHLRLTDEGMSQLRHLRRRAAAPVHLPKTAPLPYYPRSLRAPDRSSS